LMIQAEGSQGSVPRVLLVYDGTASAQQSLLRSESLSRWPEAVFLLVAALQGAPAGSDQDDLVDFFPEAAAAERAHVRFVLEQGADFLRSTGFRVDAMVVESACVDELVRIARTEAAALVAVAHRPEAPWSRQWWQTHVVRGLIDRLPCGLLLLAVR
ncbi:MAG: universal stress protein, partial [Rubrivivax sp.]